jgi:hypothetical protein
VVPVCVYPTHQAKRAFALAEHCLDLDGTVLHLIEHTQADHEVVVKYPQNRFHTLQARALHRAAQEIGTEFIWLEADSIPIRPGWVRALTDEYWRAKQNGKKFMLSSDHQPHDLIGGIGCYSAETGKLVPLDFERSSWDLWLIENVPELVYRSPLIQHSYGIYGSDGFVKYEHRFPRDQAMLRPEAVIFHRDRHQDLIGV